MKEGRMGPLTGADDIPSLPLSIPLTKWAGTPLLLPGPAVGWLGWHCTHLSCLLALGHLAEPVLGDSCRA